MRENVYCKISGMATESDWSHWSAAQLQPYFDTVLAAFGPQRLMFGSDWPVLTVAGTYRQWVEVFQAWIAGLSAGERESMCSGTATFAYQLQADR
jgi:L-fuconolactonase